jgi:hypothetical protein
MLFCGACQPSISHIHQSGSLMGKPLCLNITVNARLATASENQVWRFCNLARKSLRCVRIFIIVLAYRSSDVQSLASMSASFVTYHPKRTSSIDQQFHLEDPLARKTESPVAILSTAEPYGTEFIYLLPHRATYIVGSKTHESLSGSNFRPIQD